MHDGKSWEARNSRADGRRMKRRDALILRPARIEVSTHNADKSLSNEDLLGDLLVLFVSNRPWERTSHSSTSVLFLLFLFFLFSFASGVFLYCYPSSFDSFRRFRFPLASKLTPFSLSLARSFPLSLSPSCGASSLPLSLSTPHGKSQIRVCLPGTWNPGGYRW